VYAYFVLLQVGFALLMYYYINPCALTARFHPYLLFKEAVIFCGTFRELTLPLIVIVNTTLPRYLVC